MTNFMKKQKIIAITLIFLILISGSTSFAINDSRVALKKNKGNRDLILKVQAENKLNVDGIFGPATQKALNGQTTVKNDKIPNSVAGDHTFITINKDKKILTLYKKGRTVGRYPVALGKASTPTPSYKWTVSNKAINPYWGGMGGKKTPIKGGAPNNPLGKRWLGLSGGGYRGYGIHGNASRNSIGKYVSAGCIRMINSDVENIYPDIPVGTKVWIGSEKELSNWGIGLNKGDVVYKGIKPKPVDPNIVKAKGENINIQVNKEVKVAQSYNIKNNNYIKIRDLAALLNDTDNEFNVEWDSNKKVIKISKSKYNFMGGELDIDSKFSKTARINDVKVEYKNKNYKIKAYNINGFNYVQLRDFMNLLDIRVLYDEIKKIPVILSDNDIEVVNSSKVSITIDEVNYDLKSYNIKNNNYIKLRDLAYLFNNTNNPFEVKWDNKNKIIELAPGAYSEIGHEGIYAQEVNSVAYPDNPEIIILNEKKEASAYNIDGNNYFKLRDIVEIIGSEINFDKDTNVVIIESKPIKPNLLDIFQASIKNFLR